MQHVYFLQISCENKKEVFLNVIFNAFQCDVEEYLPVKMLSSHPHVEPDGTVWNIGTAHDPKAGYSYAIVKFQKKNPNWTGNGKLIILGSIVFILNLVIFPRLFTIQNEKLYWAVYIGVFFLSRFIIQSSNIYKYRMNDGWAIHFSCQIQIEFSQRLIGCSFFLPTDKTSD